MNLYSMIFAKIFSVNPRLTLLNPRYRSLQYIHLFCESPFHSGLGRWRVLAVNPIYSILTGFLKSLFILRYACAIIPKIGCIAFARFPKIGCNDFFKS